MKKFLGFALAIVMVMSVSTAAFASGSYEPYCGGSGGTGPKPLGCLPK